MVKTGRLALLCAVAISLAACTAATESPEGTADTTASVEGADDVSSPAPSPTPSSRPTPSRQPPPPPPPPPSKTEAELQDEHMALPENGGWSVAESGNVYYRFLDDDEFSCGNYDCVGVAVAAIEGCPGGVYIEAAIESGGVVVGRTNEVLGALDPEQVGAALLEDVRDIGDTFKITEINCRAW